jgi:CHASE1-domain containing sensor protein
MEEESRTRFSRELAGISSALTKRVELYANGLYHTRALFEINTTVTRDEFRQFVARGNLVDQFPGIQGVGFAERIARSEVDSHEARIRGEGFRDYHVHPRTDRDEVFSIIYLEPFNWRNRRAFGFDMSTEPNRWEAMIKARDTGAPHATRQVRLLQETDADPQPGFIIYLPLYGDLPDAPTVEQRRAALKGYVSGVIHDSN